MGSSLPPPLPAPLLVLSATKNGKEGALMTLDPTKVVPNVQQSARRYLVPDDRDFFAVYRRLPGPITVPFS